MNFVAQIGITEAIDTKYSSNFALLTCKVEKLHETIKNDNWYDLIPILLDKKIFHNEIQQTTKGAIVGIKGYLSWNNKQDEPPTLSVVCERMQVF